MIPIYLGYDTRERIAYHVLQHSILEHASQPCAFTAIGNTVLPGSLWARPKGKKDSTEFSTARFMVPALQNYRGWAIFMDCDMLCMGDIANLWAQRDDQCAVMVVKHQHEPREQEKFLGAEQTQYGRKNWSSLMLINCAHPAAHELSPDYVNRADGLELHQFAWAPDEAIGEIRGAWNVLSTPQGLQHPTSAHDTPHLLHYTHGGAWHGVFTFGAGLWTGALKRVLAEKNPRARAEAAQEETKSTVTVTYDKTLRG